jgi:hypothetical protein
MRRHFGIGPIDLRIVKAGLDDGGLRIVGTSNCGTPSIAASARTWASIQSGSACVQLACAKVKLEAPSTATKICAMRISPVSRSTTTGTPSPA